MITVLINNFDDTFISVIWLSAINVGDIVESDHLYYNKWKVTGFNHVKINQATCVIAKVENYK